VIIVPQSPEGTCQGKTWLLYLKEPPEGLCQGKTWLLYLKYYSHLRDPVKPKHDFCTSNGHLRYPVKQIFWGVTKNQICNLKKGTVCETLPTRHKMSHKTQDVSLINVSFHSEHQPGYFYLCLFNNIHCYVWNKDMEMNYENIII